MIKTTNLNVKELIPIVAPYYLRQIFPLSEDDAIFVTNSREQAKNILFGDDNRLMVVVGPCSIHDPIAAMDYATRLANLAEKVKDKIFIVMRVYFEKPRTNIGWKGLINDPDMDGSHLISKGLGIARKLLYDITKLRLPVACEMLDTITPQYLSDMITWGAIGARTTESQPHREMASGLSFPVGFKNGTDGNLKVAVDAMLTALRPHSFLGINGEGKTSIVKTTGNRFVHIVLRGGAERPNYYPEDINEAVSLLEKNQLPTSLMVDVSHGNSMKDHRNQPKVFSEVLKQIKDGNKHIKALMVESFINEGNQQIPEDKKLLKYGVSVTDKCIDWKTTEEMLLKAYSIL
ncbi:3-deoxy-7-phosphoheptulonate synthase [Calditerrivibrio nitroreducens]|uniref:Phospho-2-dehydro-3-deoxyheptonate aldolase n=1 Tax=Calditerrivibrio nitroreducens (strain DSM 19672 / NBRC 101217 / Yu37-1) TaxID=768670 RepID=E4TGQ0_CALNY|nr:3-deoxy-7-phosphoheptulonate synthase [Calditerrivibrio nitroreducens]ADR19763.1 3-deoxy-D-arabinoheptulosonate-7-phosphate synthase [Calditerrivibrio nitroreducens DSM 19672]